MILDTTTHLTSELNGSLGIRRVNSGLSGTLHLGQWKNILSPRDPRLSGVDQRYSVV